MLEANSNDTFAVIMVAMTIFYIIVSFFTGNKA